MDLTDRLAQLESMRDWNELREELEKGIGAAKNNDLKAQLHLRLGRILDEHFQLGAKALKHFQDAYKLAPALVESLEEARRIYWDLGKLNMVQKLLDLELKAQGEGDVASQKLLELANVLCDTDQWEQATPTYARSLGASGGKNAEASACLEDVQIVESAWEERVGELVREAHASSGHKAVALFLRAARILRRFQGVEATEGFLRQAYKAEPTNAEAAALFEGLLVDQKRLDEIETTQKEILAATNDNAQKARLALAFGRRWAMRHNNPDAAARFLEEASMRDPSSETAYYKLVELYGAKERWADAIKLADRTLDAAKDAPGIASILAFTATFAWRQAGDMMKARGYFARLKALSPEHRELLAFEKQIGEALEPVGAPPAAAPKVSAAPAAPAAPEPEPAHEPAPAPVAAAPAPTPAAAPAPAAEAPVHTPAAPAVAAAAGSDHAPDEAKAIELKGQLAKFEAGKRWGEVAKTLVSLVGVLNDDLERVEAALRAADIYANQLRNQVEAIKAYELVRSVDPTNPAAVDFLVKAYEARREFEKLLALRRQEADDLPAGPARAAKFAELARLATEKVKKPEVCIAYWKEVLDNDDNNLEAITQLSGFYDRAKDYTALASVLEKEAELTTDRTKKIATLKKLAVNYGDKLENDEGAVEAWRKLLALDPNDKQAQEALKKKYLSLHRWDDLEVFYAESGKWDEFIRVLEQQEAKETANDVKAGLLFKIAQLWNDRKQKADRAAKAYERVLELDPQNLNAAEALIPIYQAASAAPALARVYEVKLGHVEDPFGKLELLRDVAALYETKVGDPGKAFDRFRSAFEIAPDDDLCCDDLERVAKTTSRWDEVVAAYQAAIKAQEDPAASTRLRLRLGRVFIDEVKKVDEAVAQFRAVYEENPENADALAALERLYRHTGRFEELLAIYDKKRQLAADAEERKGILYATAKLYVEELKEPQKAVATYREVLEDAPEDETALAALDALYGSLKDWPAFVDVLRKRLELPQEEHVLVDLKYRLAQALETHLGDIRGALDNYREILQHQHEHDGARVALENMLGSAKEPELTTEVAAILESIYEAREDWERLIGVLEILAKTEVETSKRVELLRKISRTAIGMLGDAKRAFDATARALAVDPTHEATRKEIEELAQATNDFALLVEVLSTTAAGIEDPTLKRDYWFRIAGLQEQKLGKVDDAAQSYRKVLELDPADADALAALEQLYLRTERWPDLIAVVQKRIDLADDPASRESLYGHMAAIYDGKLGKPEEAIACWREVLSIDPASNAALTALDKLYEREQKWSELAENLDAQLRLADTDEAQLALMLRLGAVRESRMGEVEQAIEIYRQVIEREPTNAPALAALERLGKEEKHELPIAEILEPLYKSFGDWAKLIGVYEVLVRRSDDPERRVELLHQIASLYEDQGNQPAAAFDAMARALAVDPSSEATMNGLARLAEATGRHADLGAVLDERAAAVATAGEAALASTLQMAAARVHEEHLRDVEGAVARYRKVLELDAASLPAAEALERLFQLAERWADLSAILQRKSEILEALEDKKAALFSAATIEEDVLQRADAAIAVYQKVLELDPEDERALEALMKHFLELQRWQELLAVYQRKVDLVGDPDDKKRVLYQMGAVWERELKEVDKAIDTYQKVLELDPADLTALGRLDVLYQASQNWAELLGILQRESELCSDPGETISYQYRIAELYETHLADVQRAIELYRDVLNAEPSHAPTLRRLEALKDGSTEALAAANTLEPVYEGAGDWGRLVSVLEVQVTYADDALRKVELLHRIARLWDERLNDANKAFDTYARALTFDNTDQNTLISLESLADRTNRWPEVGKLYDAELDKLEGDPAQLVELGLRVAQIFEIQLNDLDGAVARFRRVLTADPENQQAIKSLDRLFSQAERWSDLAQVLAREAEIGQTPDEILELKFRLGEVQERHLNDLDSAISAFREVLAVEPEHQKAMTRLEAIFASGQKQLDIGEIIEPLYRQFDQWDKLVKVYEAQLTQLKDAAERLAMYYRIAELHEEKLADGSAALDALARAFKEQPLDERAHEEAERIAGAIAAYDTLANAYADVLGSHQDKEIVRLVGGKLARTFEEQLGDQQKAEETFRFVLGVDATDTAALENLDRIYVQWAAHDQLANILVQRTKATQDDLEKVELYARLGQVYEEALGKVDEAIAAYRVIFDGLDKAHEQAIAALARLYEQKQAWKELLGVYERELENAVGDVAEADIQAKIANLLSNQLGDIPRAVELWKRVLDLRGEDAEALGALAGLYERQKQWPELVEVLERQSDASSDDGERTALLSRRARIYTEQLGRDDLAIDEWQRVLDINAEHVAALRAIADIRRRQNDPAELVIALQNLVERASRLMDEEELINVFRELGKTYGEVLEQPVDAADAWRKLLEVNPADFEAMAALEAIYRRDEQWTDVIGVKMGRAAALGEPAEQIRELFEVVDLWHDQVQEPDGATPAAQKILELEPNNERAFKELEVLHTNAARWAELAELYVHWLEQVSDVHERSDVYRKIAKVLDEKLDDSAQAFDILVNALSEDFDDDATVKDLERVAQATNRWGDLLQTANAWLKEPEIQADTPKKISLMLRLAKWYGEDIGKPEWAMPYFQQVQKLDPHNVRVIRQVASLYKKAGNYDQVGQTLTNALEIATSEKDRKEICLELGDLLERHKSAPDQAIVYYRRGLDVDPAFQPAIDALERLYQERGLTREIMEMLERKVQTRGDASDLNPTRIKLAGMYVAQQEWERPGQLYRDALEGEPQNLLAMRGLKVVYEHTQDWTRQLALLEAELEAVQTERERVEVLLQLAALLEDHFIKPDLAAQRLEQALEIDPNNDAAYRAVERCYAKLRRWHDQVAAFDRHIASTTDDNVRVEMYAAMGKTYSDELDDAEHAIDAYRNITDIDPNFVPALEALSRLYEKTGDTSASLDAMQRVADLTLDTAQKVDMLYRIGKAQDEKLGDRVSAQERFRAALDLDPTHLPSLAALRQIALDTADWYEASQLLDQEQTNTAAPRQKAKLLVELGKLREEMLGEHDLAIAAFEAAIEADAENEDAAMPLANEYVQKQAWERAEPLLDLLTRKANKRDKHEQHVLFGQQGKTLAALGKFDRALRAYQQSFQADPTDMEVVRGLADTCFSLEDWPAALSNYQKVLTSLDESEAEQRTEVYYRLGQIKRKQGQARQAITNFEKALEIDGAHRPTLEALVGVYTEQKDWKQVVEYKRQVLDNVIDGDERYGILLEIGDIWADQDKNLQKAIDALEEALELRPEDHKLLHKMLTLYQGVSNWFKMIDTVERIANLETNAERKSKYFYTIAQLYRDKEDDQTRAVEYFNLALDNDPTFLKAFEAINKIVTAQKDWKNLERAYRKMLHRIAGKGQGDLEFSLWHGLGLIYRDRLKQPEAGVEAFKMSSRLKPEDMQERQILAELYESAGQLDMAVSELQDVLARDAMRVDPYQSLYKLYMRSGQFDRAWCIAAALSFLKKADGDQTAFFEERRPKGMLGFRARLDNEAWVKNVFHPEQDKILGKIFEMITPAARTAKLLQLRAARQLPDLPKKFLQDPQTTTITFAKAFFGGAQILSVAPPALYVRNDVPGALTVAPTDPVSSVAGSSVLSGFTPQELMFLIGKHLTYYRGEHYLKTIFPSLTELKTLLLAAVKIAMSEFPLPPDLEKGVMQTAQELVKYMQPVQLDGLRLVVKHFVDAGAKADIKRWMQTSDVTAMRAGFVLCGDLEMSAKLIRAEPVVAGDLSPTEKLKELIQYSVSEQYFNVRQTLGIAIS